MIRKKFKKLKKNNFTNFIKKFVKIKPFIFFQLKKDSFKTKSLNNTVSSLKREKLFFLFLIKKNKSTILAKFFPYYNIFYKKNKNFNFIFNLICNNFKTPQANGPLPPLHVQFYNDNRLFWVRLNIFNHIMRTTWNSPIVLEGTSEIYKYFLYFYFNSNSVISSLTHHLTRNYKTPANYSTKNYFRLNSRYVFFRKRTASGGTGFKYKTLKSPFFKFKQVNRNYTLDYFLLKKTQSPLTLFNSSFIKLSFSQKLSPLYGFIFYSKLYFFNINFNSFNRRHNVFQISKSDIISSRFVIVSKDSYHFFNYKIPKNLTNNSGNSAFPLRILETVDVFNFNDNFFNFNFFFFKNFKKKDLMGKFKLAADFFHLLIKNSKLENKLSEKLPSVPDNHCTFYNNLDLNFKNSKKLTVFLNKFKKFNISNLDLTLNFLFKPVFIKFFLLYWDFNWAAVGSRTSLNLLFKNLGNSTLLSPRSLFSNNLHSHEKFTYIFKKRVIKLHDHTKFSTLSVDWHYQTLVKFLEFCSGKQVFFKVFSFLNNNLNFYEKAQCLLWSQRVKYFRKVLGPRLFLNESLQIIYLSLKLKDPYILSNWMVSTMGKISFWKHKTFLRYIKYVLRYFFWIIFKDLKVRGVKYQLKGKISVAGNARTRTVFHNIGFTSHTTFNNKILYKLNLVRTFTGVLGLKLWIVF